MRNRLTCQILIASLASGAFTASARWGAAEALNPADYKSPSGRFVLGVDPSDRYGRGDAHYQVTSNGVVVWSGKKPFTLCEAGIVDVGIIGGYAYSHGLENFGRGEFHIVIMRADGQLLLDEAIKCSPSRYPDGPANPQTGGILVDGPNDRFVILMYDEDLNRQQHTWWTYQLSTGKLVGKLLSGPKMPRTPAEAEMTNATAAKPAKLSDFADQPLKLLGTFMLRGDGPTNVSAIREIAGFDVDGRGHIGFIRREGRAEATFVHITTGGKTLREVTLPIPIGLFANDFPKLAWLEGNRWIIAVSDHDLGGKASAWWLNALTGEFIPIPGFNCLPIEKLAGMRDGGFVALVVKRLKYSREAALNAFDKTGTFYWEVRESHDRSESGFLSPEDVTVTANGRIAVLDKIRKTVQYFDSDGSFLASLTLAKLWRREPNYPTTITADKDGGILIKDFNGNPPVVRMDANGKVISQFTPKHPDGRVLDAVKGIKMSPANRVWACDGECFGRLTDEGVADLVLGSGPDGETLGGIVALTVDLQGRLYAVDERTGAVHVYDEDGVRRRVCKPKPTDFQGKLILANVAVTSDGAVYVTGLDFRGDHNFVRFAPDGNRNGTRKFGLDSIKELCFGLPAKEQMLVLGYHDAFLVEKSGKVTRTIQRRPDRKWLEHMNGAAVAPDGSFAITTGRGYWYKQSWQASLYGPDGEPVRTITMPAECMDFCFALTGKYLATRTESEICLFKATGEPLLKFAPTEPAFKDRGHELWSCFATKDGRELWFVSPSRRWVWRYALPG